MKPPICSICDKRFNPDDGDIVYFKRTKNVIEWEEMMEREGKVGHPPNAEWFCSKHLSAAEALKHLPVDEAMQKLREQFQ
ncbi:MAG: hypothetical protein ACTSQE_14295 [Candidatus Heimdallarchaeaceae archaeon]